MTTGTKNILKCIGVLAVISLICVALLSVANVFLIVKPTLDLKTAGMINEMCPTGVDAQTAFDEGYFMIYDDDTLYAETHFDLKTFNKENGTAKNKVLAVYRIVKGEKAGCLIVESTGQGYKGTINILTAFDLYGNVVGAKVKSHMEDAGSFKQILTDEYFTKLVDGIKGTNIAPSTDDILSTGATTKSSVRGVQQALSISVKLSQAMMQSPSLIPEVQ